MNIKLLIRKSMKNIICPCWKNIGQWCNNAPAMHRDHSIHECPSVLF